MLLCFIYFGGAEIKDTATTTTTSAFAKGTTSKVAGLLHTIPLMLNVKQESCKYQFLSHLFDRTRNRTLEFTNPEADALSIRPSDRQIKFNPTLVLCQ